MSNITVVLREEISRLARKEIKNQTEALRKASSEHRKKIAEMKRQVSELQRKVTFLEKQVPKKMQPKVGEDDTGNFRFSARGLHSNRKRLGLSLWHKSRVVTTEYYRLTLRPKLVCNFVSPGRIIGHKRNTY